MKIKILCLIFIVLAELLIITQLFLETQSSKTTFVVAAINKSFVSFETNSSKYDFFYEPKENECLSANIKLSNGTILRSWKYCTNNDTLYERFNYTVEKGRDVFRIIILGDSFVEGLYVNSSNKFTEVLEDELNIFCKNKKAEVLNLGVSGYDISYMVERFKKRGIKYNPDLVLVWVKRDDFDVINDIYIPLFHYYLEKYRTGYYDSDHYANRVAADHYSTIINNYSYNKPLEDSILFPLSEIVNTTKYIGSKLIFFTHHGGVSSGYFGNYDTIVNNLLGGKNTFYYKMNIDAKDWEYKYSIIPPGSIEYDRSISDSHPNESGHFIIAKKLFQFLSENNFLAC